MDRRGVFEVQFNWIFVLVAGAVILAFFFSIVQKQRVISEEKLSFTLANDLDTLATAAQQERGTSQLVELPGLSITFSCPEDCSCSYGIGSEVRPFGDKLIFAPDEVSGRDILLWTLDWKLPFRVTNFLFVTNDRVQYVLVFDPGSRDSVSLSERFKRSVPREVNLREVAIQDVSRVKNENFAKLRFVFLGVESPLGAITLDPSLKETDVSAVEFEGDVSGTVTFFTRSSRRQDRFSSSSAPYLDESTLFAAVFAEDATMYRCNLAQAFRRLGFISDVYSRRVSRLAREPISKARGCAYDLGPLIEMNSSASVLQQKVESEPVSRLLESAKLLSRQNDALLRRSCVTVY